MSARPAREPRTKFLDFDSVSRQPKTNFYCMLCQRDLNTKKGFRRVRIMPGGGAPFAIHPDDYHLVDHVEIYELGLDCAKRFGLEWTTPKE